MFLGCFWRRGVTGIAAGCYPVLGVKSPESRFESGRFRQNLGRVSGRYRTLGKRVARASGLKGYPLLSAKIDLYGEFAPTGLKSNRVCGCGGMADRDALKASVLRGVRVRVSPAAPSWGAASVVQVGPINLHLRLISVLGSVRLRGPLPLLPPCGIIY